MNLSAFINYLYIKAALSNSYLESNYSKGLI